MSFTDYVFTILKILFFCGGVVWLASLVEELFVVYEKRKETGQAKNLVRPKVPPRSYEDRD